MLYIFFSQTHADRPGSNDSVSMDVMPSTTVVEDEVDLLMYKEDGKIYRKKDLQLYATSSVFHRLMTVFLFFL